MMTERINSVDSDGSNLSVVNEGTNKTFQERLEDMPVYTTILNNLRSIYSTLKGKHEYVKSAFNIGEVLISDAKPVILAATDVVLKLAEPVVGEIKDPAAYIDGHASDILAKLQKHLPIIKQTPGDIMEAATSSTKDTANYYYEKIQGLAVIQNAVKQLDNAVSLSDLMVELCFPSDGTNPDDMQELEQDEQDEDNGVLVHAGNVKRKAFRRGTRKLMTYKIVITTANVAQYAQSKISETTGFLMQRSNYLTAHSTGLDIDNTTTVKGSIQEEITEEKNLVLENWNAIYKISMLISDKTYCFC